jgi:hypothetical protein
MGCLGLGLGTVMAFVKRVGTWHEHSDWVLCIMRSMYVLPVVHDFTERLYENNPALFYGISYAIYVI